jgi:type IV fimbrial biogenesis protein FimT
MLNLHYHRGVTMTEVLMVVAIVAVVMGLALPSFQVFVANQRIRTVAESLRAGMQLARIEALKRGVPVFFDMATLDSSWQVGCETPDANDNDGDGQADCPAEIRAEQSSAPGGTSVITITTTAGTRSTFNSIGLVKPANLDGSGPVTQLDITVPGISSSDLVPMRVLLPAGGLSRVCNPAISTAGDSRKC